MTMRGDVTTDAFNFFLYVFVLCHVLGCLFYML
eukprot:COSAG05_NODE_19055_length_298_cov_1.035176_1_plen_32_part_01